LGFVHRCFYACAEGKNARGGGAGVDRSVKSEHADPLVQRSEDRSQRSDFRPSTYYLYVFWMSLFGKNLDF
jgi:hypothetical protein